MSKLNYNKAVEELDQILSEIESGNIDIDNLSKQVKRAGELILFCQKKLRSTEKDIDLLLTKIDADLEDD